MCSYLRETYRLEKELVVPIPKLELGFISTFRDNNAVREQGRQSDSSSASGDDALSSHSEEGDNVVYFPNYLAFKSY